MIIEDIYGNIITNPNLEKGRLEKSFRENEDGERYNIYIYFPFSDDEQEAYNVNNQANITHDKCSCVIYENTKDTIKYSDTDPFCYAYARRVKRDELTINECPEELRGRIEELAYPNGECSVNISANNGTIENLSETIYKGSKFTFDIVPNKGYRLPYYSEMAEKISVSALTEEKVELPNFFENNCSWEELEDRARVVVSVPVNCAIINSTIECVKE